MTKRVPKHIIQKVERMSRLMDAIVGLNIEVEEWLEKNDVEDGFDFTYDYRDERGYGITDVSDFIDAINAAISEGE